VIVKVSPVPPGYSRAPLVTFQNFSVIRATLHWVGEMVAADLFGKRPCRNHSSRTANRQAFVKRSPPAAAWEADVLPL